MTALRDDERLFCAECGDEARYSKVGKTAVIVFGHMGRIRRDHPVRLAPASRDGSQRRTPAIPPAAGSMGSAGSHRGTSDLPETTPVDSDRARRRDGGAVQPADLGAPPRAHTNGAAAD